MYKKYDKKILGLSQNAKRILKIIGECKATDIITLEKLADEVEIIPEDIKYILDNFNRRGLIDIRNNVIELKAL
jgi:DNA-binding MarR family transcriptional regulator